MEYYSTLGLQKNATQDEIKQAFRQLAKTHHPDKGGDPASFQKISEAYDTLSDPQKRAAYDRPQQPPQFQQPHDFPGGFSFNFNGFDLNDIFGQAFGHAPQSQQHAAAKQTYRTRINVSLVDAFTGAEQTLQLGTPTGVKVVNIKIPPGIHNGSSIRYDNIIENGSLIIEFIILPDLRFEREGDDLYSNYQISVLDLIVGTKINFTTINGKKLEVNIAPNTQPSQHIKIAGYGMPRNNGTRGDQILLLRPHIPANVHTEVVEAIKRNHI